MDHLIRDLRYALRGLGKSPGFTAVAVITIALGVGANTAMFSVVDAVLLSPLPYRDPSGITMIWSRWSDFPDRTWISVPEYYLYKERTKSFADVAAWSGSGVNLTGGDAPERVQGAGVTANLFAVLGVEAAHGRTFRPDEDQPGKDGVVVLSDGLFHRRFGGDPAVVGRSIDLNGEPRLVVGVMPPGFALPLDFRGARPSELWFPDDMDRAAAEPFPLNGGSHGWYGVARLAPGSTPASAAAELRSTFARLTAEGVYLADRRFEALVVPVVEEVTGQVRPAVLVLLGAVAFVLAIACANVASLLLARRETREREIAVRTALGASRRDLLRQLLTESLLLAGLGGLLGLWLAGLALDLLVRLDPASVPRLAQAAIDGRVLAFTLGVTFLTGLLFGLAPALQSAAVHALPGLKEGGRTTAGVGRRSARRALVVVEVALAVVLVTGAGLMIRTVQRMLAVDPGFRSDGVLTMRLTAPSTSYPEPADVAAFYAELLGRVRALPGVRAAGGTSSLALTAELGDWGFMIEGRPAEEGNNPKGDWLAVTPGYFESLGIRLVAGRLLTAADDRAAPLVAVINEELARAYWPDGDALGKRILSGDDRKTMTIVGIVADVRHNALTARPRKAWYRPYAQFAETAGFIPRSLSLVIRSASDPAALVAPVSATIRGLDQAMPVAEVRTMDEVIGAATAQSRFTMLLLLAFGTLALALASIGIYGVMSYSVARRTHEIGVRIALGAQKGRVLKDVVGEAMLLTGLGLVFGLGGALALSGALSRLLYEVSATDPATFAGVAAVLAAVALAASVLPGHRAATVDPVVALKGE